MLLNVCISAKRNLAPTHPLYPLLEKPCNLDAGITLTGLKVQQTASGGFCALLAQLPRRCLYLASCGQLEHPPPWPATAFRIPTPLKTPAFAPRPQVLLPEGGLLDQLLAVSAGSGVNKTLVSPPA